MKLNELKPKEGATHNSKRVGRGVGSGKGKTCGVGVKGQKARSGVAIRGFEGGQMPIYMRLPKRGFNNIHGLKLVTLSLSRLQMAVDKKKIDPKAALDEAALEKAGVVTHKRDGIRLVASGELKTALNLTLSGASEAAVKAVEKAGGKVAFVNREVAPVVRKKQY